MLRRRRYEKQTEQIFCTRWRGTLEFFWRRTSGGWLVGSWRKVRLFLTIFFCTMDPCSTTNFSQLWREFFLAGNSNWDVRRIVWIRRYKEKRSEILSQISGWISVGRENNCLESHVLCPRRLKVNKGEKYNHSRLFPLLNYAVNIKKFIIKFKYAHPSARIQIASVQIVSRIENAAPKERRANRDCEIFNMTRG